MEPGVSSSRLDLTLDLETLLQSQNKRAEVEPAHQGRGSGGGGKLPSVSTWLQQQDQKMPAGR